MLFRPVNLAIVDDHLLFRKTLKNYLSEQKNLHVPILAADLFDLLSQLKNTSIDILLIDISVSGMNSGDAMNTLRNEYPNTKILVLSIGMDMDLVSDLLDAGIHGYVSKYDDPEELIQAIQAVSEGRLYRNSILTEALYWNKQHSMIGRDRSITALNDREKRILQLIWEEKSNKEIAEELFLGVRSVEKIRQDLKEKLGAKSTIGLLKYAITKRIIWTGICNPSVYS